MEFTSATSEKNRKILETHFTTNLGPTFQVSTGDLLSPLSVRFQSLSSPITWQWLPVRTDTPQSPQPQSPRTLPLARKTCAGSASCRKTQQNREGNFHKNFHLGIF